MKNLKKFTILVLCLVAVPSFAKDGIGKESRKEKKRLEKKIEAEKKAKFSDKTYVMPRSKFAKRTF